MKRAIKGVLAILILSFVLAGCPSTKSSPQGDSGKQTEKRDSGY